MVLDQAWLVLQEGRPGSEAVWLDLQTGPEQRPLQPVVPLSVGLDQVERCAPAACHPEHRRTATGSHTRRVLPVRVRRARGCPAFDCHRNLFADRLEQHGESRRAEDSRAVAAYHAAMECEPWVPPAILTRDDDGRAIAARIADALYANYPPDLAAHWVDITNHNPLFGGSSPREWADSRGLSGWAQVATLLEGHAWR